MLENSMSRVLVSERVDGYFIFVRDLRRAIPMYGQLFGYEGDTAEILFDHLYFLPNGVILDSGPMKDRTLPEWLPTSLKLSTCDIDEARDFVQELGFTPGTIDRSPMVSWFLFKDPDGNTLMMCQDRPGERGPDESVE